MIFVRRVPLPAQNDRAGSRRSGTGRPRGRACRRRRSPSPARSRSSTPRNARKTSIIASRDIPGLRTWTSGSSRHSSVAISVPRPFTSIAPPSRTTPLSVEPDRQERKPERRRGPRRDERVLSPVRVSRPGVEPETRDVAFPLRAGPQDEDRADVARPAAIGGETEELHAARDPPRRGRGAGALSPRAPSTPRGSGRSRRGDLPRHLPVRPRGWRRTSRASRSGCAASRSRSPRAAPTPPASGNALPPVFATAGVPQRREARTWRAADAPRSRPAAPVTAPSPTARSSRKRLVIPP